MERSIINNFWMPWDLKNDCDHIIWLIFYIFIKAESFDPFIINEILISF